MDDKSKYGIIIIILVIGLSLYIVPTNQDNKNNTTGNITDVQNSEYKGIDIQNSELKINYNKLLDNHMDTIDNLESYKINTNNGKIKREVKVNDSEIMIIKRSNFETDTRMYQNDRYRYEKQGSSIEGLSYDITEPQQKYKYPKSRVKSILQNSKVRSYTETQDGLLINMRLKNEEKLKSMFNVTGIYNYDLELLVTDKGIISSFNVGYVGVRNGRESFNRYYYIEDINNTSIDKPSWLSKARDINNITESETLDYLSVNKSGDKISIQNMELPLITNKATIKLKTSRGSFNSTINESLPRGKTIHITDIKGSGLIMTNNSNQRGNLTEYNVDWIIIKNINNKEIYNKTI